MVVYGRRRSRWISAGCFAAVPRDALLPRGLQLLLGLRVWGSVGVLLSENQPLGRRNILGQHTRGSFINLVRLMYLEDI